MMNLRSMGAGSLPIPDIETYRASLNPGHFWCTLLTGAHVSTDAAIVDGKAVWWRHATGATAPGGTFDHWHIHAEADAGHRGLVRRLDPQAPRRLHRHGQLRNHRQPHHRGASALRRPMARPLRPRLGRSPGPPLRRPANGRSTTPAAPTATASCCSARTAPPTATRRTAVDAARRIEGVSSVQISFHQDRDPAQHSMPPGGFRLAIINATSTCPPVAAPATSCNRQLFTM